MLKLVPSVQFRRDLKAAVRRGQNIALLDAILQLLVEEKPLPPQNRDHPLSGEYRGCRECHISPDWLLVYKIKEKELELYLLRTGSHSELFKK